MDKTKIVALLRATMDPVQRKEAEKQLNQLKKITGVIPTLLEVVMSNEIELAIRQAGVIYMKNIIFAFWSDVEEGRKPRFVMDEKDRSMLKDLLVEAVVFSPPKIQEHLCLCVKYICQTDFPERWPLLVKNICVCIENPDAQFWSGALSLVLAILQAFNQDDENTLLGQAMTLVLPKVQERMVVHLMNDGSQQSLSIQYLALKLFYSLTKRNMTVSLLSKDDLATWMQIILTVLDRKNPEYEKTPENEDDEEKLVMTEWWKTKHVAMRILFRIFDDYVSPGIKEVTEFSTWYLNTFSVGALQVIFNMLDAYRKKEFVADKVLADGLFYLQNAVSYADMWNLMKPFATAIISDVVHPLLCFSKADERLWIEDPIEFIQVKYGEASDDVAFPAEQLLHSMCTKRKGIRQHCLAFITQVLNSPNSTPEQIDGGLHMFGSITDSLLTREEYQDQFENVISGFVFPAFASKFSYLRSRVAWLLFKLSTLKFKREDVLQETIRVLLAAILTKEEQLPVKVQAALTIHAFILHQYRALEYIEPLVPQLCIELLELLRATEFDDLTDVLRGIVCEFVEEVAPVANDICAHLAQTFFQVTESNNDKNSKLMLSMSLLSTMVTFISVMNDLPEASQSLEPILVQVVRLIFEKSLGDFYTEGFSLIASLTHNSISSVMWQVFEMIYRVVERDGIEFFKDMTVALYNYMTVDTEAFLSDQSRLLAICAIMKEVFSDKNDSLSREGAQCHAAKLMEVLILQFRHRIQNIIPTLIQLVVNRLSRPSTYTELRTICVQVILASLYHDADLTIAVLPSLDTFIQHWILDGDCFFGVHDRRICVLGFCSLLQFLLDKGQNLPPAFEQHKATILPLLMLHLDTINTIYSSRTKAKGGSKDRLTMDCRCYDDPDVLGSDEDEIDDDDQHDHSGCSSGSYAQLGTGEDSDSEDLNSLDRYVTPLDEDDCPDDEFVVFKQVLLNFQNCEPVWYAALTDPLNEHQQKSMKELFTLADARKEAALSKQIKKNGGYEFSPSQPIPAVFNFGPKFTD